MVDIIAKGGNINPNIAELQFLNFIDDDTRHVSVPLIFRMDDVCNMIIDDIGNPEVHAEYTELISYIINPPVEHLQDGQAFLQTAVNGCAHFISDYIGEIEDTNYYEVLHDTVPDDIFGYVYYDYQLKTISYKIWIMKSSIANNLIPYVKDPIIKEKLKEFKFTEIDYWRMIEADFMNIHAIFGGGGVRRLNPKNSEIYHVSTIGTKNEFIKPDGSYEDNYYKGPESVTKSTFPNITKNLVQYYDHDTGEEWIRKDDDTIEKSRIKLFTNFEDVNVANTYAFHFYQKFKKETRDHDQFVYAKDNEFKLLLK